MYALYFIVVCLFLLFGDPVSCCLYAVFVLLNVGVVAGGLICFSVVP